MPEKWFKSIWGIIVKMGLKKTEKYRAECEAIVERLRAILELDADNSFYLCELDGDEEKQRLILELIPEIKVNFGCKKWNNIEHEGQNRLFIVNLIKNVFKHENFLFLNKRVQYVTENNETKNTSRYYVIKKSP